MYRLNLLILLTFWWVPVQAVVLPDQWQRVGQAELKVLWFDIYHAELLTADGRFVDLTEPLLLSLTYKRDISKRSLLKESEKELMRFADREQVMSWINQLAGFWTDVKEGDNLVFYLHPKGDGHFFLNDSWLGVMTGAVFTRAFASIWLSDQSRYSDLAASLKGEKSNTGTD